MAQIHNIFTVTGNDKLCEKFYRLSFDAKKIRPKIKPGQFVHIKTGDGMEPFFRRPFSVYRAKNHVEIFYEAVGRGTKILSLKKKGDPIDVLGPVGTPFALPPKGTKQIVMIDGGIGIAPF